MIRFACSECGRHVSVDDRHAGKKGKCPKCGAVVVVPERSTIMAFRCDSCGQKIKVPASSAGRTGKCPKCKAAVVVPALPDEPVEEVGVPPEVDAPTMPEVDEALYEAAPDVPEASEGVNRRLILIIGGVAAVVLVGCVILVVALRSGGSGSAAEAGALRGQREVGQRESVPEPVGSNASPAETGETVRLQFCPAPGPGRTMEVTTALAMSGEEAGQRQEMTAIETWTFDLEVNEPRADGAVPIRVTLAAIRVQSGAQGGTLGEYDSRQPQADTRGIAGLYGPFIGQGLTIGVSAGGDIVDFGLDELFQAVAENPLVGREKVRGLLGSLVAALPENALRTGESWTAPIVVDVGAPLEMTATYTLEAVDDGACTIAAMGQRALEEAPIVYDVGDIKVSNELGGSSEVTLTVDRDTGWLLSKKQTTRLSGQMGRTRPGGQGPDAVAQISLGITTTVKTLE